MRVKIAALLLIVTSALAAAAQAPAPNVAGNWLATLDVGGAKLRLALKIKKSGDGYAAKLDSLDQGVSDMSIDSIVLNGNKLSFSAAGLGLNYEGTLNAAGDEITGTFKQRTIELPLVFKRIAEVNVFAFDLPYQQQQPVSINPQPDASYNTIYGTFPSQPTSPRRQSERSIYFSPR